LAGATVSDDSKTTTKQTANLRMGNRQFLIKGDLVANGMKL